MDVIDVRLTTVIFLAANRIPNKIPIVVQMLTLFHVNTVDFVLVVDVIFVVVVVVVGVVAGVAVGMNTSNRSK